MIDGLKPYPAMKDSGMPWLGEVPEDWDLAPNRTLLRRRKVLVGSRHTQYRLLSLTKQGVIVRDVDSGRGKFSADMGTSQEVRAGDLVFCLFDVPETPRTVGLSRHDGMITGAYTVFECCDATLAAYLDLYYRAMDDRKLLSPLYSGLRNTIPPTRFLGTKSPVPPPTEQAAIVRFLDHADRRIRRYIRAKQRLIDLLEEQKQAIIHRAVARGLDPNVGLKPSGVEWLGDVPAHWEVRKLTSLCSLIVDGTHFSPRSNATGDYLYITAKNIKEYGVDTTSATFISAADHAVIYQRCPVVQGDVLYIKDGATAGIAAVNNLERQFSMLSSVALLRPKTGVIRADYLSLCLNESVLRRNLLNNVVGGAMTRFTVAIIKRLMMLVPPAREQDMILQHLTSTIAPVKRALAPIDRELSLLREYRTRLIADVVTGKLDVREAAVRLPDESEDAEPLDEAGALADGEEETTDDLDAIPDEAES